MTVTCDAVNVSNHIAYMHFARETGAVVEVVPVHYYNTEDEIERFVAAVEDLSR